MPTESTIVTKSITYKIPNELFSQDDSENKTATTVYTGPEKAWVFVDSETGKFRDDREPIFLEDDGPDYPAHSGTVKIEISIESNPFEMALIMPDRCETQNQSTKTEDLPDGSVFEYNDVLDIDDAYDLDTLYYDLDSNTWQAPKYRDSDVTWEDVINVRNGMLLASDGKIAPDMPEEIKQPWIDFRQALRDLPKTFGKGTANEIAAWKVQFPAAPGEE
jgi:hypothetical protein